MFEIKNFTKETNLKDCGVYMITHKNTDIKYIGSTIGSEGFQGRWRAHLNGLGRNKGNIILLRIKNKYGIEGFEFHIIERIKDLSIVRQRERYWIEYFDTYKKGANLTLETNCAFKSYIHQPMTEEQKQKYFDSSTTKKTVYVYDENGELFHIFASTVECDKFFGLRKGRTSMIIHKSTLSSPRSIHKQFYPTFEIKNWNPKQLQKEVRLNAANQTAIIRKQNGSYSMSESQKNKIRLNNVKSKKVGLFTMDNTLIKTFNSLNEVDDYLNLTRGSTSKVLNGKAKTLKRKFIPKLI